jgi:hypothetical protein
MIAVVKYLAWFAVISSGAATIGLIIMAIVSSEPAMVYLRGLIVIPFALWWGIRELKRSKENESNQTQ